MPCCVGVHDEFDTVTAKQREDGRGVVDAIVWCCVEGMGEFKKEEGTGRYLEEWLAADVRIDNLSALQMLTFENIQPSYNSDDETPPAVFECALARVTISVGGAIVIPSASQVLHYVRCLVIRAHISQQHIPFMLGSHDWRLRHAGLTAITAIAVGNSLPVSKVCSPTLLCFLFLRYLRLH